MIPILEFKNINKSFVGVQALKDVSFQVYPNEVHVLVGENGAGKSTMLKILTGLYQYDNGTIMYNGEEVCFAHPKEAQNEGIAMVYQELTVLPDMTVLENVFLNDHRQVGKLGILDEKRQRKDFQEISQQYDIQVDPDDLVGDLPIAQQQMVELLKVLIREPQVIVLDEPTAVLPKEEVGKLYEIIRNLLKNGKTVLFISHRMEEIFELGDRATILKDGAFVTTVDLNDVTHDDIVKYMVGRELTDVFPPRNAIKSGKVVYEVSDINMQDVLKNVSFQVSEGEVLGIAGLQGHGQTELLRVLAGIDKPESGVMKLHGKQLNVSTPSKAIRAGIGYLPEDRKAQALFLGLSVRQNLAIESLWKRQKIGFIRRQEENRFVDRVVSALNIKTPSNEQLIIRLSGGNQQKTILGKVLEIEPKVLIFNEPTRGIDIQTKHEIYKIMRELTERGIVVILYSSDLLELIGISDRVLVMYDGEISGVLEGTDITEESIMKIAVGIGEKA